EGVFHGPEPRLVVPLLRGCEYFCRLHCGACAVSPDAVSARVPLRWSDSIYRIHGGFVANVHLVPSRLEHHHQVHLRWPDLRRADRWHLWLALAALKAKIRPAHDSGAARPRCRGMPRRIAARSTGLVWSEIPTARAMPSHPSAP